MRKISISRARSASFNDLNKSETPKGSTNGLTPFIPFSKYYTNNSSQELTSSSSQEIDVAPPKKFRPCSKELNKEMEQIKKCLEQLNGKKKYFADKGHEYDKRDSQANTLNSVNYKHAAEAADDIYKAMAALVNDYNNEKVTLSEFKHCALMCINNTHKLSVEKLRQHRGCKEILANLLVAVLALPVYLVAALYKGTFFVVRPQTDAGKKVDALTQAVKDINEVSDDDEAQAAQDQQQQFAL